MVHGHVLLKRWRAGMEITQTAAAKLIGIGQDSLSGYESGAERPKITNAIKIEKGTAGAVPVSSWAQEAAVSP